MQSPCWGPADCPMTVPSKSDWVARSCDCASFCFSFVDFMGKLGLNLLSYRTNAIPGCSPTAGEELVAPTSAGSASWRYASKAVYFYRLRSRLKSYTTRVGRATRIRRDGCRRKAE